MYYNVLYGYIYIKLPYIKIAIYKSYRKCISAITLKREVKRMICPKCGSENVVIQAVAEKKKRGCFAAAMWILLAICTFGLVLLIPLLTRKGSKTKIYAVCQNCGKKWVV